MKGQYVKAALIVLRSVQLALYMNTNNNILIRSPFVRNCFSAYAYDYKAIVTSLNIYTLQNCAN